MASGTPVGNMIIKVDLDSVGVEKSMTGLQRQLKSVNKSMGAQLSAFGRSEKSASKYDTMIKSLTDRHKVQAAMVSEAEKNYKKMSETYGENSVKAQQAAQSLNEQIARYQETGREISNLKKEFADFQKQQKIDNSNWTKAGNALIDYGDGLQKIGQRMSDTGATMTKRITLPALGAATAAGGIVAAFGWKRLTGLDSAQAQLKGLGYNTEEVGRISDQVTEAIEGGMTTMAEGTSVAAGAMAAGVKEGKELKRYIKLVGDAAVGANRPVGDMAQIFNRVQGSGKLMTQELNMIEDGMPGFAQAMAKNLGVSQDKFREMVTAGKVDSKRFLDVMEDFAGGMAGAYADSWDGMVENTKAYIGIIGENFLRGVFQDSKKSLSDFIELLKSDTVQKKAQEMGEKARVAFGKMKDAIVDTVKWYTDLEDSQKKMVNYLGIAALAMGPVLSITGKLTKGIGATMKVIGGLSKVIGTVQGAGLAASLASLGPAAIGGLAVAGIGAVAYGSYKLYKNLNKTKEANSDLAKSMMDEANTLEKSSNSFNKLSEKAKLSNDQLAEMYDLHKRIENETNPKIIEGLTVEYDKLAKESGLSKDEIKRLFKANEDIIKQTPNVEKSISDQGNAFAKNTKAVDEYIQSMVRASTEELKAERINNLKEQEKVQKEINKSIKERERIEKEIAEYNRLENLSKDELSAKLSELGQQQAENTKNHKVDKELNKEINMIKDIQKNKHGEITQELSKQMKKEQESIDKNEQKKEQIKAFDKEYQNIYLKSVGINKEGQQGLEQLDQSIEKTQKEINKLEEQKKSSIGINEEERKKLTKLKEQNSERIEARNHLFKELGQYNDINKVMDDGIKKLTGQNKKKVEGYLKDSAIENKNKDIFKQLVKQNEENNKSIKQLTEEGKKQGANKTEIVKKINAKKRENEENVKTINKILKAIGLNKEERKAIIDSTGALKTQGTQQDKNNKKSKKGIENEKKRTKEAAVSVVKDIFIKPDVTAKKLNDSFSEKVKKVVDMTINPLNKKFTIPFLNYAQGTSKKGHPFDGPALVNDGIGSNAGQELIQTPDGKMGMFKGRNVMANLPKGTHVLSAKDTRKFLGNVPKYAKGTINANFGFKGIKSGILGFLSRFSFGKLFNGIGATAWNFIKNNLTSDPKQMEDLGGGPSPTGGAGSWRGHIKRASMRMNAGATPREISGIVAQINRESGGNERIVQSPSLLDINTLMGNPAKGLLQYIPQTFNAYKMRGYGNIFKGYHQLLAFFNNSNWRRDLPYGRRGWGPSGHRRYKRGTNYVPEDGPAYLHKGEAVVPKEFNKPLPTEAMKLLALAGKRIQGNNQLKFLDERNDNNNKHLENIVSKLSEQVEDTKEIVSLLAKLLMKDSDVYIDGKEITETVNHHNALKSLNPF